MECNAWCIAGATKDGFRSEVYFERYDKCNKQIYKAGPLKKKSVLKMRWGSDRVKECIDKMCRKWKVQMVEGVKELLSSESNDG